MYFHTVTEHMMANSPSSTASIHQCELPVHKDSNFLDELDKSTGLYCLVYFTVR